MATMKTSELIAALAALKEKHGDVPVVLWDMDSSSYFSLTPRSIEAQRMADDSVRISMGPNGWDDPHEDEPANRPLK